MASTRRVVGLALCTVVGGGVLLGVIENIRSRNAVRAYKAKLVAQGEKLLIDELIPPLLTSARTAAIDFVQAASSLSRGAVLPAKIPTGMRYVAPARAAVVSARADLREHGWETNTWEELSTDLQRNATALRAIEEALKSPDMDAGLNYHQGISLYPPSTMRIVTAQWLTAKTICDLRAGRLNEAMVDLESLLALSRVFRSEPLLISQLVRMAVAGIALPVTWEALQTDGWTDAQLAQMQYGWESLKFIDSMERALQMERAIGLDYFNRLRNSGDGRREAFSEQPASFGPPSANSAPPDNASEVTDFVSQMGQDTLSKVGEVGSEYTWLWLWSYRDEYKYLEVLQMTLDLARESRRRNSFVDTWLQYSNVMQVFWQHAGFSTACFLTRNLAPPLDRAIAKAARLEVQRELAITAIALKRYRLRHGAAAPALAALVPEFLKQPPVDFMDGKELRYRPNADGTFLLYSVGDDGKDDGGDPRPQNEKAVSRYFGLGRDTVWPMPASPEEIAEAERQSKRR